MPGVIHSSIIAATNLPASFTIKTMRLQFALI